MKIISDPATFAIQPRGIATKNQYFNTFGSREAEVSAAWIVDFCQNRGSWAPFTLAELETFYKPGDGFRFNALDTRGYIPLQDGKYHITEEFVKRIHQRYPAPPAA